jgi:hypothetical protein
MRLPLWLTLAILVAALGYVVYLVSGGRARR